MSDLDDEKGGPQVVPDGPPGAPSDPTPANEETAKRRDAEHREDGDRDDRDE
ncbi:MAG TPA: hypothetical protein VIG48_11525 [Jatrophihabitans sp.]|jgi:hypothetical protein